MFLCFAMMVCHMMHPGGNANGGSGQSPPVWGPHMQERYPFREWSRNIMVWSILVDFPPPRKAAWVVMNLRGGAAQLAAAVPPQALINGGLINGVAVDPMTFLMHSLSERYSPLGEETRIAAMADLMNFQRQGQERIDDLITRFDITRQRSQNDGGMGLNVQGCSFLLLKACRVNDQQLLQLLQPFQGVYPANDQEYQRLCTGLRRMGHILERGPGNLATSYMMIHKGTRYSSLTKQQDLASLELHKILGGPRSRATSFGKRFWSKRKWLVGHSNEQP